MQGRSGGWNCPEEAKRSPLPLNFYRKQRYIKKKIWEQQRS
jgi:hypothetical protein